VARTKRPCHAACTGPSKRLALGLDIWLISRAVTARITDVVREARLDADEFAIYSVLASSEGMTPTELAHWMAAPPTTVSSYVKRFTRRGHVERFNNEDDRRSYLIRLTDEGRAVHRAAGILFLPLLDQVSQRLGPNGATTHAQLRSLHDALSADHA
jgi:DNA-binding MarR family transcriptional regulator